MRIVLATILLFCVNLTIGQRVDPRKADDLYKIGNFLEAIPEYKKQLKLDRENEHALFRLGMCYLYTNIDKSSAVPYLERAWKLEKHHKETAYFLAQAYTHNNQYDKAIEMLNEYQKKPGEHKDEINSLIMSYEIAIDLMQRPINVTFTNMGNRINSPFPDYYPFVSKDEKVLVFTSRREDGKGSKEFDGYYPSDIYVCRFDGITFSPAKNSGSLNSAYDEQCVGIYDDGSKIFVYIDNYATKEVGNIYEAQKKGAVYGKKKKISEGVNSDKIETSTSISSDGNTLFYASNRNGGKGGLDLFMTRKLPTGAWATPQNITALNTPGNEDFPSLSPDGKTLYFCSDGLPGMGGYDLYKSSWNSETNEWSAPINLGYPLNTSYDEKVISFADDEKHAYVSAVREEGEGDLDIYRITFEEVVIRPALYIFDVKDAISTEKLKDAFITIWDVNDEEIGNYKPNPNTQEFTVILSPGKYSVEVEANGYELQAFDLVVSEFAADNGINKKSYKISK